MPVPGVVPSQNGFLNFPNGMKKNGNKMNQRINNTSLATQCVKCKKNIDNS